MLLLLTTASGFAGLSYEVVWTRMLASVLGTEMAAVLGVVTGFFTGLALGALALDGLLRRTRSPRLAYAVLELVIAAWAIGSIWLVPAVGRALPGWLGTSPGPALLGMAGFALPAVLLLPATAAMGGTLAALERLTAAAQGRPRVAAGVYGANTAGAVAGALLAVLLLLPGLGVSGTLGALALVNLACAAVSGLLGRIPDAPTLPARAEPGGARLPVLLLTGLLGITFEVLVVRLAAQVLQDTVLTFAFLLAAFLLGSAGGGLLWQRMGRPPGSGSQAALLSVTALACLGTAAIVQFGGGQAVSAGPGMGPWGELGVACALFLLPSGAMGALFGCLAQAVRDRRGSLGRAVGVNSLGAAAGPALAALVLVPAVGAWAGLMGVAAGYVLLAVAAGGRRWWVAVPAVAGVALAMLPAPSLVRLPPGGRLLASREGPTATASVVEGADGTRFLEVNGHFRMGGTRSARSDWRQALVPLLLHPDPRRALFLGVGTGATLAGAAALPRLAATGVEVTPEVVALLPWFTEGPLPPVLVADARRFVAVAAPSFDVIVADLFHPALDGTGSLYTVEHFRAVRARLAPGGVFCQWLPLYQFEAGALRAVVRSFLVAYPDGSGWLGNFSLQTPMLALCGGVPRPDVPALARRLADPAAQAALRRTGLAVPMDLMGLYAGGPATLAAFAGPGRLNTDDDPVVAMAARRNVAALAAPPAALLLQVLRGLHPDPLDVVAPDQATRMRAYWQARDRFIEAGAALPDGIAGMALADAAVPGLLDAVRVSPEFDPAYQPLLAIAASLAATDPVRGRRLLEDAAAAAPGRGEARALLARLPPR